MSTWRGESEPSKAHPGSAILRSTTWNPGRSASPDPGTSFDTEGNDYPGSHMFDSNREPEVMDFEGGGMGIGGLDWHSLKNESGLIDMQLNFVTPAGRF